MNGIGVQSAHTVLSKQLASPEGKIIGAVDPSQVAAVKAALAGAVIPDDRIEVLSHDDIEEFDARLDRPGVVGLIERILLADDLYDLEEERQELATGYDLIGVRVQGEAATNSVGNILCEHGGHGIIHFGRWTVTTLG